MFLVRTGWLLLALLCGALPGVADTLVAIPPLHSHVTDLSGVLSGAEREALEAKLQAFEAAKGAQLAVLILPGTAPETIEQFGIRVAEAWRLGRAGVDDGLLLLVATQERTLRIEVGYGLEGIVPDVVARRVIDETIVPRFARGELAAGIEAGVQQLMRLIEGEALPPPSVHDGKLQQLPAQLPFLFVAFLGVASWWRRILGPFLAACLAGGAMALTVWWLAGTLAIALFVGLLVFVFALLPSTASPGRWQGGGSRSGGFGGGGFSGGGGGFGGGGASGRW